MTTVTLLKQDGIYIYDDFKNPRKAAQHLRELTAAIPSYSVKRKSNDTKFQLVLVSKAWWDAKILASASGNSFSFSETIITDDFLAKNFSTIADLIQGRAQTQALLRKVTDQGLSHKDFKVFTVVDSSKFYKDDSDVIKLENSTAVKGNAIGYVLHPAHFAALSATPTATTFAGAGNGTLVSGLHHSGAVAEIITVTATSPTSFTVAGSVSLAMGVLTVGVLFESPQIEILITAGSTPFAAADLFTITSIVVPPMT
jgi:hypothetical protein